MNEIQAYRAKRQKETKIKLSMYPIINNFGPY